MEREALCDPICERGTSCVMAKSAATSVGVFFLETTSTFEANFTGVPAEVFPLDGNRDSPPGFAFPTGSLSGGCLSGECAVTALTVVVPTEDGFAACALPDRKSVVQGKRVDL